MVDNIADLTARYRTDGFAVARGLFDADLLREVTEEVERVVSAAAGAGDHGRVYFDAEAPGAPVRCVFRIEEQIEDRSCCAICSAPPYSWTWCGRCWRTSRSRTASSTSTSRHTRPTGSRPTVPVPSGQRVSVLPPAALAGRDAGAGRAGRRQRSAILPARLARAGILPHEPSGVLGASRGLVDPPDTTSYPEVAATMEAGDVLVHHTNVIHRTGPNLTGTSRPRTAAISASPTTEQARCRTRRPTPSSRGNSSGPTRRATDDSMESRHLRRHEPSRAELSGADRRQEGRPVEVRGSRGAAGDLRRIGLGTQSAPVWRRCSEHCRRSGGPGPCGSSLIPTSW